MHLSLRFTYYVLLDYSHDEVSLNQVLMGQDQKRDRENINHLTICEFFLIRIAFQSDAGVGVRPHRYLLDCKAVVGG